MHDITQDGREVEEEMEEGGEEEDKEPIATADVGTRKMKTKDKVRAEEAGAPSERHWRTCLCHLWKVASIDPAPLQSNKWPLLEEDQNQF
jgi:hypothetical protein